MKIVLIFIATLCLLGCLSTKPKESVVDDTRNTPQVEDSTALQDSTEQIYDEYSDSEEEDCGC